MVPEPMKDPYNKYVVVVDLDGTLFDIQHRLHFIKGDKKDWNSFNTACEADTLVEPIATLVRGMRMAGFAIVYLTGRAEQHRGVTEELLATHRLLVGPVIMRPENDFRSDYVVKMELAERHIGLERIIFAVEDRDRVVKEWRARGITCLQPCEGSY